MPLPLFVPRPRTCACRLCREFRVFHASNPEVYREFVRIIERAMSYRRSWGIGAVCEIFRWERSTATATVITNYKIDNNHRSRYARMILINEPKFRGFLKLRRLHTVGCVADEIYESIVGVKVTDEEGDDD